MPAIVEATRLVDLRTAFGLPLVFLRDLPGVLVGQESEKVTVVLRKAFGFEYIDPAGAPMGTDCVVAWPNGEIGLMSAHNAVQTPSSRVSPVGTGYH